MTQDQGYVAKGGEVIREAEEKLRDLIADAASFGAYNATAELARLASSLDALLDARAGGLEAADHIEGVRPPSRRTDRTGSEQNYDKYPQFYRDGRDRLVVVGWSKEKGREYKLRVAKDAINRMPALLVELAKRDELVSADALKAELKMEDGTHPPGYYVDTFLRWLRHSELVTKHGHRGYSIERPEELESECADRMKRLRREPVN